MLKIVFNKNFSKVSYGHVELSFDTLARKNPTKSVIFTIQYPTRMKKKRISLKKRSTFPKNSPLEMQNTVLTNSLTKFQKNLKKFAQTPKMMGIIKFREKKPLKMFVCARRMEFWQFWQWYSSDNDTKSEKILQKSNILQSFPPEMQKAVLTKLLTKFRKKPEFFSQNPKKIAKSVRSFPP